MLCSGFLVILYLHFYTKHNRTNLVVNVVTLTVYHIIWGLNAVLSAAASSYLK